MLKIVDPVEVSPIINNKIKLIPPPVEVWLVEVTPPPLSKGFRKKVLFNLYKNCTYSILKKHRYFIYA